MTAVVTWFLRRYVRARCVLALQSRLLQATGVVAMQRRFAQTWVVRWGAWVWLEGQP